ncbi:MAG: alpha/beta hydrolase [Thermoguttaceae bacterium]|nr:alpha/beta hydrolase [Thermoguttaceae bacterium]
MSNRLFFGFCIVALLTSCAFSQESQSNSEQYEVREVRNVVYKAVDGQELKLNLFLPTKNGELLKKTPVLIDIVSGGWGSGTPGEGGFWRACGSVESGYAVVSLTHRSVTKDCVFPAQIEDVKAGVRFLRAHADEYGLDPNRIAAMGASSGGHMASMLGLSDEYRQFDVGDNLDQSSQVQIVVDLCCTADMKFYLERAPEQTPDPVYAVLGGQKRNDVPYDQQTAPLLEKAALYSPITYVDENFSPTIILQGALDHLVVPSQSCLFYESLKRANVRAELWIDNSQGHTASIFPEDQRKKIIFDFLQWN